MNKDKFWDRKRFGSQMMVTEKLRFQPRVSRGTRIKPGTEKESEGTCRPGRAHEISVRSLPHQGRNSPAWHDTIHLLSVFNCVHSWRTFFVSIRGLLSSHSSAAQFPCHPSAASSPCSSVARLPRLDPWLALGRRNAKIAIRRAPTGKEPEQPGVAGRTWTSTLTWRRLRPRHWATPRSRRTASSRPSRPARPRPSRRPS